jgi:hypothetical protein
MTILLIRSSLAAPPEFRKSVRMEAGELGYGSR